MQVLWPLTFECSSMKRKGLQNDPETWVEWQRICGLTGCQSRELQIRELQARGGNCCGAQDKVTHVTEMDGHSPITVGSRYINTARGTCFPALVSLKKLLKELSPPPMVLSLGICRSGWIPCSKQ